MTYNLLRIASIVYALVMSNLVIVREETISGSTKLIGLPLPYQSSQMGLFPENRNRFFYAVNYFFWVLLLNIGISYLKSQQKKKNFTVKSIFSKDFNAILIFSVFAFLMSLLVFIFLGI